MILDLDINFDVDFPNYRDCPRAETYIILIVSTINPYPSEIARRQLTLRGFFNYH